jgi:hypothetical protein
MQARTQARSRAYMWTRTSTTRMDRIARRTGRVIAAAGVVICALFAACSTAHASDAVMEWNQIALAATVTAGQTSVPQIRTMAIVHVSVHDAVNAISRTYSTYLDVRRKAWGASADAAAIGAAHRALIGLFPTQAVALNRARDESLAAHGLSPSDPGVAFGEDTAASILSLRSTDGSAQAQFPYAAPHAGDPGVWVPVGTAAASLPGWGSVTPWVLRRGSQFRPDAPPSLRGRRYARDFAEVQDIGSLTSVTRTAEQTEIARFWLASASTIWNGVARQVVEARGLDLSATARVFALFYLAAADASIACWDAKYTFNFWRPITAIRSGDVDGNDHTTGDSTWAPLLATPQHPEYVSGHATISTAMATILRVIFGDEPGMPILATSPTNPAFQRQWESFSEGVDEVIDARVYSGIHYRTSDEVGATLGRTVARFVMRQQLRPRPTR